MGYWVNGTEGMDWAARNCDGCLHQGTCVILDAHDLWNYDQHGDATARAILEILLRTDEQGRTLPCTMRVDP